MSLELRPDFGPFARPTAIEGGIQFAAGLGRAGLWASLPLSLTENGIRCEFDLAEGEVIWTVFGPGETPAEWNSQRAEEALTAVSKYWQAWTSRLARVKSRGDMIRRSALTVQLLSFAPTGAPLASPTTSLPERIGGSRNFDYRYSWIRDASLSVALLSRLGLTKGAGRFFDWLEGLQPGKNMPLQVVYRIDGGREMSLTKREGLSGYRESAPVELGNVAADMVEIDSFGYLADAALTFLEHGGEWRNEFWDLICRVAEFTVEHWRDPGAGIWELTPVKHFVSSKIMSWVTLDRASRIGEKLGHTDNIAKWHRGLEAIKNEVMERGWSETLSSFRQQY